MLLCAGCEGAATDAGEGGTADTGTDLSPTVDTGPAVPGDDDDDAAGHAAACAGSHSGTYQVDGYPLDGEVQADLAADGTLLVTFTSSSGNTDSSGIVGADGTMSGTDDGVTITGAYDLARCEGSGRWTDHTLGASGDYAIARDGR